MEVEMISSEDNKLLDRKELNAVVRFDGATPNRADIRQAVATKVGLNPDMVVLNSISSEFGAKEVRVVAHAYNDMEKLKEVEPEYIRKRDNVGMEKPKEEKKEEAPAEKPSETPKEEKPEEKKEEKSPEKKEEPKKEEKSPEKKEEKPKEEPKNEEKKEEEKPKEEKKEAKPEEKK